VLVQEGVIVEVGSTRRIENLKAARGAITVSAAGRVVMPGFVDCHTHLLFPRPPSLDAESGEPTLHGITGLRLETRARLHLEIMARHGTTTVEVKTGCGPEAGAEAKLLRVLASLQREPVEVVSTFLLRLGACDRGAGHELAARGEWILREFLPRIRRHRWASFADLVWGECGSAPYAGRYLAAARALGLGRKVHVEEEQPSPAIALGITQAATSIDHLEHATAADAALLANSGAITTLLPGASFQRQGRYAPARMLVDAGVAVALASNFNPLHTPGLNMQMAVKLACTRMNMTPAEAISAATINAAYALGCASAAGSLEPGKSADLLLLNVSDYRELSHSFGGNLVHSTMKRGQFIYQEGEVAPRPAEDLRPGW
jgi:imidazolonepropionase